ncbi:MAG: VanZ family protein [Eubacteriales bacterium]|nr:VanZ family protein [Eubacteriales bacterium]
MIALLKPLSFLPALMMMYVIYTFSAQTGEVSGQISYQVAYQVVETKNELLNENKSYEQLAIDADSIHYYVRKAAHMTEYFLLAVAVSFPLYVYGVRGIWLMILAGILCVGFAGLDEYHQSFVANRGPALKDVAIDSIGSLAGILLVQAFCWSTLHNPAGSRRRKRPVRRRR